MITEQATYVLYQDLLEAGILHGSDRRVEEEPVGWFRGLEDEVLELAEKAIWTVKSWPAIHDLQDIKNVRFANLSGTAGTS